mmetsp:Transcript_9390/g.15322  ORF Transcript_9390/g.15322 Transcript_9390/m.15322 type:complete len:310 (+) Transcript_9390:59-988(+)
MMGDLDDLDLDKYSWNDVDGDNLFSGITAGASDMSKRLRTASEMHQNGLINADEKAAFKHLVLSRDPKLEQDLSNIQQKNLSVTERKSSFMNLKHTLRKNSMNVNNLNVGSMDIIGGEQFDDGGFMDVMDAPDMNSMFETVQQQQHRTKPPHSHQHSMQQQQQQHQQVKTEHPQYNKYKVPQQQVQQQQQQKKFAAPKQQATASAPAGSWAKRTSNVFDPKSSDIDVGMEKFSAKEKKNERERRRRLQVSHGFTDLFKILKMPENTKMEKSTVLNTAIERLTDLQLENKGLLKENHSLRMQAKNVGIKV